MKHGYILRHFSLSIIAVYSSFIPRSSGPAPDLQQGHLLLHRSLPVLERVDAVLEWHNLAVHELDLHV